jgi:hypothetical protein
MRIEALPTVADGRVLRAAAPFVVSGTPDLIGRSPDVILCNGTLATSWFS